MDVSPCSTASHSFWWEGTWKLKFVWNLRFIIGRNNTLWTIRKSYMLSEVLLTIFIYLSKVMKQFINNRYLSLQHSSTFHVLRVCSKFQICMKFNVCYWQKWHVVYPIRDSYRLLEALPTLLIYLRNREKIVKQQ